MSESIGVVVLAAGAATRYGASKLVLEFGGEPLVRRAVRTALVVGLTTVVTGAHRATIESALAGLPASLVFNSEWQQGMGNSIACGVLAARAQAPEISALIIMLADQPLIQGEQLEEILAVHDRFPDRIVAAGHSQGSAPPCLFPRAYFDALSRLAGQHGARALLDQYHDSLEIVPMPRSAVDIDTPQDYAAAIAAYRHTR